MIVTEGQASADNCVEDYQSECDATDARSDVGWIERVLSERIVELEEYEYHKRKT